MTEPCAPPRATTRKPRLIAPESACDCHFHIFGDAERYPYVQQRSYTPPVASETDYLRMAATLGIERMVVVQASVHGLDNSCTLDAVEHFGTHRARGVVAIDPEIGDAELRRMDERPP